MDWLNVGGLMINAVGTIMVFWFAVPARSKRGGASYLLLEQHDPEDAAKERRSTFIGYVGLVMVLAGAVMQAVAP